MSVHVGKQGVTDAVAEELRSQLKKNDRVKVRLHRTAPEAGDRRAAFAALAERVGARLEKVVGFVAVMVRRR